MLSRRVRFFAAACAVASVTAGSSVAFAQDAGAEGGVDAGGTRPPTTALPMCAGAINTADISIMGTSMGRIDALPGTGPGMLGSSTIGLQYNLLFSGEYRLNMNGNLHVNWLGGVTPLTVTTTGTPATGLLYVRYGLRMMATLRLLGASIPINLNTIIMDNESSGMAMFDPWQWDFTDATRVYLNVSAWRDVYTGSLNAGGDTYNYRIQMRFNMTTRARTEKIEFPNRASGAMGMTFGALTGTTPAVNVPVPANGNLDLAYRWVPRIKYVGSLQFRLVVDRRVCTPGIPICTNVDFPTPDFGGITLDNEILVTPWERSTPVLLPLAQVNEPEVDFGMVRIGTTGMQQLIVLNPGASPLAVAVSRPGEPSFALPMNTGCAPARGMLSLPVTFSPTSMGSFRSEVTIDSNGATNNPARVALLGIGAMETRPPTGRDGGTGTTDGGGGPRGDGGARPNGVFDVQADAGCACRATTQTRGGNRGGLAIVAMGAATALIARRASRRRQRA